MSAGPAAAGGDTAGPAPGGDLAGPAPGSDATGPERIGTAGEKPARMLVGGTEVARYVVDPALDRRHGPRPYLHPVRTLGGTVVTDALPADHVWHLGASLAVQDVNGANLWGGRTYVRDVGYTWRDDHGVIAHTGWSERAADRSAHRLQWRDRDGSVLLTEQRRLAASAVAPDVWRLDVDSALTAPPDREVRLGSPATNGRPGGAGYGGFFWRALADGEPAVFTADAAGEGAVNGSAAPWLALTGVGPGGGAYTLVFDGLGPGDRWFVRTAMYPGVCVAFAFDVPAVVSAGATRKGRYRVWIADGRVDRNRCAALASGRRP
ncbi:PmoA family protein [Micromonospora lupini]|uniref:DUF6807 domain-containing protein n=1 Tax=Micromonospora lupini TaxID=285679 RepID=UPI002252BCFA|nr:PmoA family protein [Micromonospora lupini]MCX5065251.1 PmoA family protein [Micromonospora lupini]